MPLIDFRLPAEDVAPPPEVCRFIREAERRIEDFQSDVHVPGFVPSDFAQAYAVLRALTATDATLNRSFCEWGSGFGVVACLAAMLDFSAYGIEVDGRLVDEARRLARDFEVPVEFVHGTFIPAGSAASLRDAPGFAWLTEEAGGPADALGLTPEEFAVVFAYPWPDEEQLTAEVFERHAAPGAVLVTYHGGDGFRLRRRTRRAVRGRRPRP